MKLICAADIHLGRKSTSPIEGDFSTAFAFDRLIDETIEREVDGLLLCGDILDQKKNPFESRNVLENGFKKLVDSKTQVFIISGNHDLKRLEEIIKDINYDFVHFFKPNEWGKYNFNGLDIYGFGFDNEKCNKDPLNKIKSMDSDKYILMVHGDYASSKSNYAPLAKSLKNEYVENSIITLIGHTHKYEDFGKYISIGSLQALDFGEKGEHGYLYLELDNNFNIEKREYVPLSNIYYDFVDIDVSEYEEDSLFSIISKSLEAKADVSYYRLNFEGRLSQENYNLFKEELGETIPENGNIKDNIYVDKKNCIDNTLRDYDLTSLSEQRNGVGVLAKMIISINENKFIEEYKNVFEDFKINYEKDLKEISKENFSTYSDDELLKKLKQVFITRLLDTRGK